MWAKLDDLTDTHPKVLGLGTDQRRWTWLRILLYTCRYESDVVPANIAESVPKATPAFLADCIRLRLIDRETDGTMRVHDWDEYNGRIAEQREQNRERQRRHRDSKRYESVTRNVTDSVTNNVTERDGHRAPPQAQSCVTRPVPVTKNVVDTDEHRAHRDDDDDSTMTSTSTDAELLALLEPLGVRPSPGELAELLGDVARAVATARAAAGPGVRSPRGWFWQVWRSGSWPPGVTAPAGKPVKPLGELLAAWVRNVGPVVSLADVAEEIAERERQRGESLEPGERAGLLDLWRSVHDEAGDGDPPNGAGPDPGGDEPPTATLRDVA